MVARRRGRRPSAPGERRPLRVDDPATSLAGALAPPHELRQVGSPRASPGRVTHEAGWPVGGPGGARYLPWSRQRANAPAAAPPGRGSSRIPRPGLTAPSQKRTTCAAPIGISPRGDARAGFDTRRCGGVPSPPRDPPDTGELRRSPLVCELRRLQRTDSLTGPAAQAVRNAAHHLGSRPRPRPHGLLWAEPERACRGTDP